MSVEQLSDVERLLLAQAIYNKLGPIVGTSKGGGNGLRSQMDEHYRKLWEEQDSTSFGLRFGGEKVATYSISETKPKRGKEEVVFDLVDNEAYGEWLCTEDAVLMALNFADAHGTEFARYVLENTGEIPPGVEARTVQEPDDPGGAYRCGMIKGLDADRVLELASTAALPVKGVIGLIGE